MNLNGGKSQCDEMPLKSHIFLDLTGILSPAKLRFDYTHDKDVGEVAAAAARQRQPCHSQF
jgi:hypothetical protein